MASIVGTAFYLLSTAAWADLSATFNAATDVPVTASSYTASGGATFTLNFAPEPGTNLTVVKNTGLPFIQSAFNNLANGATVNLSYNGTTYPFVAWYYGGDGNNDLVLLWPYTRVVAWGKNSNGQLGDATTTQRNAPVTVTRSGALAGKTIVQVARGQYFTLALTSEGRVYTWGSNGQGLGNSLTPVAVTASSGALFGKTVVALAAGYAHSLALCTDGTIAAWGSNTHGQLGDNTTTQRSVPVAVNTSIGLFNKTVVGLAAGGAHSLALCSDGTVAAWGFNGSGQLGDTTTANQSVPVAVNTASGMSVLFDKTVVSITAGVNHSLALCSDGSLAAWGNNTFRQLGDNTTTSRSVPVAVSTASGTSALFSKTVVVIATGELHNLALCSDGTLAAWGNNFYGQLGDGTAIDRSLPVAVSMAGVSALSGRTVVDLAAGTNHSMALCSDGSLAAWGFNSSGQLGDNTTTDRLLPVAVNTSSGISALAGQNSTRLTGPGPGAYHSTALTLYMIKPEIILRGNNVEIVNGDTSASSTDHSDFGSVNITGASVARTFTISNTDEAALNLTGLPKVVIGGIHAADFTVAAQPISPLLPFTGTSTFEIIFDPSALGVRYATVSIPNNDDNENPYNFSIQGAGLEPEIRVEQPLGTNLAVGGTRSLGQVPLGGAMDLVFTLRNTGASGSLLTGLEITLDGADASEFSIASSPSAPVLGPAGFTSFSVRFAPTSTGTKTAALHLASNDFDENPFHILLSGEGTGNVTATFNADSDVGSTLSGVNATGRVLDLTLNYAPIPGTNLTVVKSTGPAFIQGNFNNMANGSTVNLSYNGSTYPFIAWYYGGDGNDLVLLWPYTGLAAWGSNEDNQLGDNRTTQRLAPVAVDQTGVLAGKTIVQMVRGQYHTLALTSEGRVYAWGWNSSGQLGDNTAWTRSSPVAVNIVNGSSALYGKTVVSLAAGSSHSLALCSDGAVVTWGNNGYGQLGNNTPPQRNVPTAVNTTNGLSALYAKTVVSVAAGSSHSLALCSDGTVVAWGYNGSGQLGNNTTTQRYVPTAVNTTSGASALYGKTVVALAAGYAHSLALCSDGTMAAWGYNGDGQLGEISLTQRTTPLAVNMSNGTSALFGKTVRAIAAGGSNSLALCSDGTLAAWGKNNYGQLGNSSTLSRTTPVTVNRTSGTSALFGKTVTAISAGEHYTLALCSDGLVAAWGNGFSGQLGNNQSAQYNVPVAVNSSSDTSMLTGRKVSGLAGAGSLANHSLAIYGAPQREIAIRGNSVKIINGDATPSLADHTDFGSCLLTTANAIRTFTISSDGFTELNLTGTPMVVVGGTHAADFSVTTQPISPVTALVGNTTFQIKFDPSALGVRSATLSIANDDTAFTFSIQGTGGNASVPAATTVAATGISFDGATLNGKVNANHSERTVFFDYGTTTSYGSTASATPGTLSGNTLTNVTATITSLLPHTKYHFRVRAAGPLGTANGATMTFTTMNRPPVAMNETVLALPSAKVTIPVLSNDSDPDGDVLSIASFTQPGAAVGTVAKVGTNLVFTPSATFAGGHFTYIASDALGLKSNVETVWLVLADIDVPPEIEISADSAPYAMNVYSAAPFTVSESIPWLSFVMPTPDENGVLFFPAPNPSKSSRIGTVKIGGKTQTVTQLGIAAAPEITVPDPILNAAFGANYDLAITTLNGPVTYTTTGLPKGLVLSNITGHITGYPTEVKTSTVTVKAKNVWGDSNTISFDMTVLPFPPSLVGSYSATIDESDVLNDGLGGLMTMTVTNSGNVSGNLKLGAGSHAFTGRLNVAVDPLVTDRLQAVLTTSVKRTGKPAVDLTVNMNYYAADSITGDVTLPGAVPIGTALSGSKHVWHATTKPADAFKGYFTTALESTDTSASFPQGDGYLTFSVSTAGAVSWSGQLADGTIITAQSATLWANGELPLFTLLYGGKGSLSQLIYIESGTKIVSGFSLRWHKKPQAARAYAAGFDPTTLNAVGAEYLPPVVGKTLLNIAAPGIAGMSFTGSGIESVSQFSDLDQVFNVSATHAVTFAGVNPALIKLTKIDVIKGTFTGSLALKDNNPFNAALPRIARPVTFNGVLLPTPGKGTGYFLLPGITGPPANVTTSPMTSGRVRIVP